MNFSCESLPGLLTLVNSFSSTHHHIQHCWHIKMKDNQIFMLQTGSFNFKEFQPLCITSLKKKPLCITFLLYNTPSGLKCKQLFTF